MTGLPAQRPWRLGKGAAGSVPAPPQNQSPPPRGTLNVPWALPGVAERGVGTAGVVGSCYFGAGLAKRFTAVPVYKGVVGSRWDEGRRTEADDHTKHAHAKGLASNTSPASLTDGRHPQNVRDSRATASEAGRNLLKANEFTAPA